MFITEAELREFWQNGRGQIPSFPVGTRFTPAALDFLKSQGIAAQPEAAAVSPVSAAAPDARQLLLKAPAGKRWIITAQEVDEVLPPGQQTLMIHPSVTITDAAREKLRAAGVRLIPFVESAPAAEVPVNPAAAEDALFQQVKAAVRARLPGAVDEAVLDAVLRRVLQNIRQG